jgi:hypothetical protein
MVKINNIWANPDKSIWVVALRLGCGMSQMSVIADIVKPVDNSKARTINSHW